MSTVEHKGIVKSVKGRDVEVEICRSSACGNCESRGFCGVESAPQSLWVRNTSVTAQVGDEVAVVMAESAGLVAVLWGYVVPLVVFIVSVVVLGKVTGNEGAAGIISFLMLAPYYFILWLLRKRMKKSFSFSLKKAD